MNGGAYVGVFVIGLAVLLTWAIVEIVKNEKDSDGDSRPIPEGDSDLQVRSKCSNIVESLELTRSYFDE